MRHGGKRNAWDERFDTPDYVYGTDPNAFLAEVADRSDVAHFDIEPEAWAGIVSILLHLPPGARAALHRRCVRGLRRGGAFVLEAYSPRQLEYGTGGPRSLDLMVPLDAVKEELEGLFFEKALETVREVREGHFHKGKGSVVRILGIKPA